MLRGTRWQPTMHTDSKWQTLYFRSSCTAYVQAKCVCNLPYVYNSV